MTNERNGILYMIIASASFAFMSLMVKLSGGTIPLFEQVFFRNLVMLAFSLWTMKQEGLSAAVDRPNRIPLFFRCLLGFLGVVSVFYANNHLPLADAQVLQKLNPFFVILAAVLFLGERMSLPRLLTILTGFAGAVIIINPTGNFNLTPSLIGVASALFGGLAYVLIRRLSGRVHGIVIIFWFSLLSSLASVPFMAAQFVWPTAAELLYLLLIGVFAALGQYFITRSYLTAQATRVTLFDYTGVILSPILGYVVFQEQLASRTILGTILIIGSGIAASLLKDNRKL